MKDQRSKDRERRLADELTRQTHALECYKAEKLTSELIERIKSRPTGLMNKHRMRKRTEQINKRAEEKRKLEMSEQKRVQVNEELIAAWRKWDQDKKGGSESLTRRSN